MFSFDIKDRETLSFVEAVVKDKQQRMEAAQEWLNQNVCPAYEDARIGSSFDDFLKEEGIYDDVTRTVQKRLFEFFTKNDDVYFSHPDEDKCL